MKSSISQNPNKLLLVDDDQALLSLLKDYLDFWGYQVTTVNNGQKALEEVEKTLPDVIICDIMMPDLNGHDFLINLRNQQDIGWVPVIFLSALWQSQDRIKGLNLGANVYMTKPIEPEELLAQIESLLDQSSRIKQHTISTTTIDVNPLECLTPAEIRVLKLVAQGVINKDIGLHLNIGKRTVETHIYNILGKTRLNNRTELAMWAIKYNI
jgi:DNA-binding NarL/FixJ family response regulator